MFRSTPLVPVLTGFPVSTRLLFSGVGTLLFCLIARNRLRCRGALELVFPTVGRGKLETAFVNSVRAIEARNDEPATPEPRTSLAIAS